MSTSRDRLIGGPIHVPQPDDTAERKSNLTHWGIAAGLLLPPAGFVIAIVLLAKNRVGPGLAVLLTCFVGMFLGLMLALA